MTDEQMLKEIIERRRQWGETRGSDFDWLMNHIEYQQKEIELLRRKEYKKQQEDIHDDYISDIMASIRFD